MTEISSTELDEIMWANSDVGKAAFDAAWAKAKALGIAGDSPSRPRGPVNMADVGAIVWAAHQATAASEEDDGEAEPASAHLHAWTILSAQEAPVIGITFGKPMPKTIVLATCTDCGQPASWLLDGTWTLEDLHRST